MDAIHVCPHVMHPGCYWTKTGARESDPIANHFWLKGHPVVSVFTASSV
ncbi:unnamed protein product [Chondrus crispus]|uniref:Uncharacterized protein n=1 Tax=Chondrus crispus TaxID=2769 RepID=S0F398_CHOCR|nr:unnamed protein product [Chondrus crispus]CDF77602.1 unnamed protein product [Chondrus crispus]|eukprot:XP_005718466.1 unnamed protein product [Chondrus crispus]